MQQQIANCTAHIGTVLLIHTECTWHLYTCHLHHYMHNSLYVAYHFAAMNIKLYGVWQQKQTARYAAPISNCTAHGNE